MSNRSNGNGSGRRIAIALLSVGTLFGGALSANASGTGSFEVGAYFQPPKYVGGDYNTNANYANIAAAHIENITAIRAAPPGFTHDKTSNETGIANSYANNVDLYVTDSQISGIPVYTAAQVSALQTRLAPYLADSRVSGINIKDEPLGFELEGYANVYKTLKAASPNTFGYVNLLPLYAPASWVQTQNGKLVYSNSGAQGDGSYVTSGNPLGQSITIPAGMTYLDGVELYIDSQQWAANETLYLKLWDSPSKTSLLSQAILTGTGSSWTGDYYRYFQLAKAVTPGATYFLELVHTGGGNNTVGWVVRSASNVYAGGQAYENGVAQSYDFYFRLFNQRDNYGTTYENYLDDWVSYSGADYILYDNYPFRNGYDDGSYFQNAEYVRDRGLANDVKYGGYLQVLEIKNSAGTVVYRNTTMNERRWNVYTFLTYGFKKMDWFTYWLPDGGGAEFYYNAPVTASGGLTASYTQVQTLSEEMRNLGGTLKDLTSLGVYHAGTLPSGTKGVPTNFFIKPQDMSQPIIEGYFNHANGRKYVMLTNRDYGSARTLSFNLNPKPASLAEISKTTGLEVGVPGYNAATGVLNITLAQGEGRLFALPVGFEPTKNLAEVSSISATSSFEASSSGWRRDNLKDKWKNNGWSSNDNRGANHTESVTIDLGASKTVAEVDLFPRSDAGNVGAGFPIDFTIQTAASAGGPWTTVVSKSGYAQPGNSAQWFAFAPVTARYVKIQGTNLRQIASEAGTPYRMQFAEIEIYSAPNYAKGATITATSSAEGGGWGIANLNDMSLGSGFSTNNSLSTNHTESITLDLQTNRTFSSVDLFPRSDIGYYGAGFPVNFTIQVAASAGGPWTTVVTQTGYAQPGISTQSFAFASQTARFVKLEATSLRPIVGEAGSPYRMQFMEIEVH